MPKIFKVLVVLEQILSLFFFWLPAGIKDELQTRREFGQCLSWDFGKKIPNFQQKTAAVPSALGKCHPEFSSLDNSHFFSEGKLRGRCLAEGAKYVLN